MYRNHRHLGSTRNAFIVPAVLLHFTSRTIATCSKDDGGTGAPDLLQQILAVRFAVANATQTHAGAHCVRALLGRFGFEYRAPYQDLKEGHFGVLKEYHFARLQLKQLADATQSSDLGFRGAMKGLGPSEGLADPLYVTGISPIRSHLQRCQELIVPLLRI